MIVNLQRYSAEILDAKYDLAEQFQESYIKLIRDTAGSFHPIIFMIAVSTFIFFPWIHFVFWCNISENMENLPYIFQSFTKETGNILYIQRLLRLRDCRN